MTSSTQSARPAFLARVRHTLRNEQNQQNEQQSPISPNEGHSQWEAGRLLLALVLCALVIGIAIAYEKFG